MSPFAWLNPGRWLLYGALVASLVLLVRHEYDRVDQRGYDRADAIYRAALSKQRADASAKLAVATAKVLATEQRLNALLHAQELKDAENTKTTAGLRSQLRAMSRAGGGPGLRDPFPSPSDCRCRGDDAGDSATATAGAGAKDPAKTGRLLSPQLEEFLLGKFGEADELNDAYASCRNDSINIRSRP